MPNPIAHHLDQVDLDQRLLIAVETLNVDLARELIAVGASVHQTRTFEAKEDDLEAKPMV